jgi:hypothetical protein
MYTLCRFFVFEGCYTTEQLAAMSQDELRGIDEKIRVVVSVGALSARGARGTVSHRRGCSRAVRVGA